MIDSLNWVNLLTIITALIMQKNYTIVQTM